MDTSTAAWPGGGAVAGATGKVFFTMDGQDCVCSGAVVGSTNADVVITAGHCVKNGQARGRSAGHSCPVSPRAASAQALYDSAQLR